VGLDDWMNEVSADGAGGGRSETGRCSIEDIMSECSA